jgi:teichuronic acid biosynthesis glycosyltransferase TuaG
MDPLVSIITPLHNAEHTIQECMNSVFNQTYDNWEHIITDNLSTDNGPEIVTQQMFKDPRVSLLKFEEKPSAGLTRNVSLEAAKGQYIAFLDADDFWDPKKLELQIKFMQDNDLSFSWTSYRVMKKETQNLSTLPVRQSKGPALSGQLLSKKAVIGCLTAVYDTHKLGKVKMKDIKKRQDFVLFVELLQKSEKKGFKCAGLTDVLATYRVLDGSLSSDKKSAAKHQWNALVNHCGISKPKAAYYFITYTIRGLTDAVKMRLKG